MYSEYSVINEGMRSMKIEKEFVLREVADEYVIIPTGKTVLEFNDLITTNEIGAAIWKMLGTEITFEALVKSILDEYDVEEQVVREDVSEFLYRLADKGILTIEEEIHV